MEIKYKAGPNMVVRRGVTFDMGIVLSVLHDFHPFGEAHGFYSVLGTALWSFCALLHVLDNGGL